LLRNHAKRLTLYEYYKYALEKGPIDAAMINNVHNELCRKENIVCIDDLRRYPKTLSKQFRYHEKRLLKVISSNLLNKLKTDIMLENGKIILRRN